MMARLFGMWRRYRRRSLAGHGHPRYVGLAGDRWARTVTDSDSPRSTGPERASRSRLRRIPTSTSPTIDTGAGRELVPLAAPDAEDGTDRRHRRSDVDRWGRSEHFRELTRRVYEPIYSHWFRVEWEGFDHLPDAGRRAARREPRRRDPARRAVDHARHREGLAASGLRARREPVPRRCRSSARCGRAAAASPRTPTTRTGCCTTNNSSCWCSPRERRAPASTTATATGLRRFGRGGFVEIAMRAGVPVIPIAVMGAEEAMPILFKSNRLAKALEHPLLPDHREHADVRAGRSRRVPARPSSASACCRRSTSTCRANQERYSRSRVMEESERIRRMVQDALYDMLRTRRSVWFG